MLEKDVKLSEKIGTLFREQGDSQYIDGDQSGDQVPSPPALLA